MAFGIPTISPMGIHLPIAGAMPGALPAAFPGIAPTAIPAALPTAVPTVIPTALPTTLPTAAIPTGACSAVYAPIANICNQAAAFTQVVPSQSVLPVPNYVPAGTVYGPPMTSAAPVPVPAPSATPIVLPTNVVPTNIAGGVPFGKGATPFNKGATPFNKGAAPFGKGALPLGAGIPTYGVSPWGMGLEGLPGGI